MLGNVLKIISIVLSVVAVIAKDDNYNFEIE